jgi:hypothetical protein
VVYITKEESLKALKAGKGSRFHYSGESCEVDLNTEMKDMRYYFGMFITVTDVLEGQYSTFDIHELKILPEYFQAVADRDKTFEIRKNDRDYKVGDRLILREYESARGGFTGRELSKNITYITDYAQADNYVVMSIC